MIYRLPYNRISLDTTPYTLGGYRITQLFDRGDYSAFGLPGHEGLDVATPSGTPLFAITHSQVSYAGWGGAYGWCVYLKWINGPNSHTFIYAHMSKVLVKNGQYVNEGDPIGFSGNTGNSTGAHLHMTMMIDGQRTPSANTPGQYYKDYVDPLPYFVEEKPEQLPPGKPVTVLVDVLNIRKLASATSERITTVYRNQVLRIDENQSAISDKDYVWSQLAQEQTINKKDVAGCWVVTAKVEITPWVK